MPLVRKDKGGATKGILLKAVNQGTQPFIGFSHINGRRCYHNS